MTDLEMKEWRLKWLTPLNNFNEIYSIIESSYARKFNRLLNLEESKKVIENIKNLTEYKTGCDLYIECEVWFKDSEPPTSLGISK